MEYTDSVFNTTPLISELSNVLESGVKSILKDFIDRYILLEETQKKILQILGGKVNPSCSSSSITQSIIVDETAYKKEILLVLSEMADIIRGLKSEIQELKEAKRAESVCDPIIEKNILIEPHAEKENIKLEIEEPEDEEDEDEEQKEEEEEPAPPAKEESEEEDEDDEEEEQDEEESEDEEEPVPAQEEEPTPVQEDEEQKEELEEEQKEEPEEEQDEEQKEEQDEEQKEEQKEEQDEEQNEEPEQKEQEDEQEEQKEDEEQEDSEQEEEELFEIDIDDVTFCTNDDQNGFIYELLEDSEVGKKIGYFKEGEPIFYDSS